MFAQLISTLKKSPKTIVFTEGTDPRILEASARLLSGNFLKPVLVGNPDEIAAAAEDIGFNIRGAEIIDPENYDGMDEMVDKMVELRKGKMTADECRAALKKSNYFGTMLVKMGKADCLLGGATYSTADTVRPALQLIKTKPGNKIVSSCFIMVRPAASGENEVLAMADCAINIKPNEDELVEICKETVSCAKIFGVDPKVAFLSYSTLGSGKGEDVDKAVSVLNKEFEAEIEESTETPGYFRLIDPYGDNYPYSTKNDYDNTRHYYMEIDASDPECVMIKEMSDGCGYNFGVGKMVMWSRADRELNTRGKSKEEVKEMGYFGKCENGVITFPDDMLLISFPDFYPFPYYANVSGKFRLVLPEGAGVGRIEATQTEGNEEIFDLNGRRVQRSAMTPGMYILRQNGKTTKVLY